MSKYFTAWDNFAVDTIGTNVAGWTERGSTGPNSQAPAYGTPCFKKRYLALKSSSSATPMRSALSWDAIDADANRDDVDMVSAFSYDAATVNQLWLYARGVGGAATAPDECYMGIVDKSTGTNNLIIARRNAATTITTIATASLTLASGKNYFIRFRVNGTALKLRVWDAALGRAGEPTTWNLETTDATWSAAGWVGLGMNNAGVADQVAPFNFLAVGTNGDSAVCPLTNAEYTAWLASQEARRVITARMAFTGYDSSGSPYTATRYAYVSNHGYTSHAQDTPASQHFDNYISAVPTFSREMPAALSGQAVVNFGEMRLRNPAREIDGAAYLLLDGSSGCYASTPDAAVNSITGDIDIRVKVAMDDWTPSVISRFVGKFQVAGQQSYFAGILTTGVLFFEFSTDGSTSIAGFSSVATGFADGSAHWIRMTRVSASGVITFYTSEDGVTYTQLGTTASPGAGAIFNSTSVIEVGSYIGGTLQRLAGKIYRAQIYNGIAGTLAVDFNLANVIKGATSFSTPTGEVWTVNGTAKIRQAAGTAPGQLDDWLRVHWIRDGFEMQLGAPDWPLHDFRHIVRGRLGLPTAPRPDEMVFRIADMSDALNVPLGEKFTSGDRNGQYKPILLGGVQYGQIEPPETDSATQTFTVADAAIDSIVPGFGEEVVYVSDDGVLLDSTGTITGVNNATETLSDSGGHGLLPDAAVIFNGGPAGLVDGTVYYVISAGWTANDFRVSATRGGLAVDITGTTTGGTFYGYNYVLDKAAATIRPLADYVGRVMLGWVRGSDPDLDKVYERLFFSEIGLSLNHKDASSFSALATIASANTYKVGIWLNTDQHFGGEVGGQLAKGSFSWYGLTSDGLLQVGLISLPTSTAVQTFDRSTVKTGSLRLVDVIRPMNMAQGIQSYEPWFVTRGALAFNSGSASLWTQQQGTQLKSTLNAYSYGAAGIPLDDHPDQTDANEQANFDFLFCYSAGAGAMRTHVATLFKHTLGIYEFDTTLPAAELNIGDTITLDFPRLGWKTYSSADPASPDNTATIDATKAVVIGLNINYSAPGPFKVRVKCFRRQPGYYPTANLN